MASAGGYDQTRGSTDATVVVLQSGVKVDGFVELAKGADERDLPAAEDEVVRRGWGASGEPPTRP
ncbi:MAG: hypothetical protein AVDCRST_MAG20-903 [uncultured Acidimicrobiales bacterium]|uniref:Uncharacterized protein n=1 Tax=uncultured Acidimicrobiales bacterium TaxID=310071 RepID=A0A6J4HL92_9ACTN|nr:MAG: hypothetical protein AVDCRST_MAG20-903 [uncultured Acidimicrobiales bacterium]